MARMKQVFIDGSALQGVDLSKVPNQKIALPKAAPTTLNALDSAIAKASISTAAAVSNAGAWAAIPQDFSDGSLSATIVVPTPTVSPTTPGPLSRRVDTLGITIGLTALVVIGVNMSGGLYWESRSNDFGLIGSLGFAGSTSLGVSGAIDVLFVDGPIAVLDGVGIVIIVDVGVAKSLFTGFGILCTFPGFKVLGYVCEFGGGDSIGPPITLNVQLSFGGHVKMGSFNAVFT